MRMVSSMKGEDRMATKKDDVKEEVIEETIENGLIYSAISKTMKDIGIVGKDDVNKTQGFKYRGIDAVMNALNPAMIKNGIFVVPEVLEQTRENRQTAKGGTLIYSICKVKYKFYAKDGSSVEATVIGEGMDSGDKATNKAMSIAFKYACFQVFCIPTEEMQDPDAETPEESMPIHNNEKVTLKDINTLKAVMEKKGVHEKSIISRYEINSLSDLTFQQFNSAMQILSKQPDKESK